MSENFDTQSESKQKENNNHSMPKIVESSGIEEENPTPKEYFVLRNNNHVGPFSQKKILELYYQENLNEYSLIWKEGFEDWTPLKKISSLYKIIQPKSSNDHSLPDLPDLRLIEMEAQRELAQKIPPPKMRKKFINDTAKRNKVIKELESGVDKVANENNFISNSSNQIYTSNFDEESKSFTSAKVLDTSGIRISLPPLPQDDMDLDEFFRDDAPLPIERDVPPVAAVSGDEFSKGIFKEVTPEIEESRESRQWIYNLMTVSVIALFVTIPLFYVVISNRPTIHSVEGMSKEGLQRINLATSEMYNQSEVLLNMAVTKSNALYAGINRSGQFRVKGILTPVERKIAGSNLKPIIVSGDSVGGLIKFSLEDPNARRLVPGLYKASLNLADSSNIGKIYQLVKLIPLLEEVNFIKNYQRSFSINQEVWLGPHSIFLTKRFVEDYQREVWENISRPFDNLFQHYDTLLSLMERFNEIFFNATTAKEFSQSKIIFARKYGREIAPILQMIASEELTDEAVKELELPENFTAIYKDGFVLAQSVARSVSAVAGDIDLFLSVKRSWNRYIRIEQRNKVSKNLVGFRNKIRDARESLEKKVDSLREN